MGRYGLRWVLEPNNAFLTFKNWNYGQPNGGRLYLRGKENENCAEIHVSNGKWNDVACSLKLSYVCKKTPGELEFYI